MTQSELRELLMDCHRCVTSFSLCARLTEALAALDSGDLWPEPRPIEEAEKRMDRFILANMGGHWMRAIWCDRSGPAHWRTLVQAEAWDRANQPTVFLPLPPDPQTEAQKR